jgi:preprotein translocase subunit YajC
MFTPKLNQFKQVATSATSQQVTGIKNDRVIIISGIFPHYVAVNTTATTSSIYMPTGTVLEFEKQPNDVINVRAENTAGHITILY